MATPTTRQSHMKVHMGKSAAVDDNHQVDNIAYKRNVVAKTSDYTILAKESGTCVTTTGAADAVTLTLPVPTDGLEYLIVNTVDQNLTVASGTADKMVFLNDAAADSIAWSTASEKIGAGGLFVSDGTLWLVFPNGFGQTNTVAT